MNVTKEMLETMEKIRSSGVCNMFDKNCVIEELEDEGIYIEKRDYFTLLDAFEKYCNREDLKQCPSCGGFYENLECLSRKDNETMICENCGTNEALKDM